MAFGNCRKLGGHVTSLIAASVAILGLSATLASSGEVPNSVPFMLTANVQSEAGHKLELTLTNTSGEPLKFFKGVLSRSAVTMVVTRDTPYGDVLEELAWIDDPPPGEITLAPGESHARSIDLDQAFPSLSSEFAKGALIVFWTAAVRTSGAGDAPHRFGGYLVISPK